MNQVDFPGRKTLIRLFISLFILIPAFAYPDYTVHTISVVSNWKTRDPIILQELSFSANTNLTPGGLMAAMDKSVQSLKNLGILGDITVTFRTNSTILPLSNGNTPVDMTVTVTEKWTLFPIPYVFYNNKAGLTAGFLLNELNLFGLNINLNTGFEYQTGPDQYKLTCSVTYPRIFGSAFQTYIKLTYLDLWDSAYSGETLTYRSRSTSASVEWKILDTLFMDPWPFAVGVKANLDLVTNRVLLNQAGIVPDQRMNFYISAGLEQGLANLDGGAKWGDDNNFWAGISPLDASLLIKFQNARYVRMFDRDVLAYLLGGWIAPGLDQPLDTGSLRGIKLGEVRGNYIFFANLEYRKYVCTIDWPTVLEFYIPAFLDLGNGSSGARPFAVSNTMVTAGLGIRLYPKYLGGRNSVLRIDTGLNLTKLFSGTVFGESFYIGFDFSDLF